jgi:peptidyl-prolyl cis-trans isomerase SurA
MHLVDGVTMRLMLSLFVLSWVACAAKTETPVEPKRDPGDPSRILREANDDPVAVRIDGMVVLRSELETRVQSQVEQFRRAGRSITQAFEDSIRVALLHHLIDRAVLSAEGKRLVISVSAAELEHHEKLFRQRLGNQEAFDGYLLRIGRDLEAWQADQTQHLLQAKIFERTAQKSEPSDAELRKRYSSQEKRYARARRLRLAEILIAVPNSDALPDKVKREDLRAKANLQIKRLMSKARRPGQRFSKLAAAHSQSLSASRGGDLGWRFEGSLSPAWQPLLKGAKKGSVVGPIDSPDGQRLIKVVAVEEAHHLSFEDVRVELARSWQARRSAEQERALVAKLRAEATIVVEDQRLKGRFPGAETSAVK